MMPTMTGERFQEILRLTGMSKSGAARLLGHDDRTMRHWETDEWPIPRADALALELMVLIRIKPARAYELATGEKLDARWFTGGRGRPPKGAVA